MNEAKTPVILLNAPSGYGKSVLVNQWSECDPRPLLTLLLSESHNDPVMMLRSIIETIEKVEPLDQDLWAALSGPDPGIENIVLPRLFEALSGLETPIVLFLDELEHIRVPQTLAAVSAIGSNLPAGSQLIIATRIEPALPIGKLRAHRILAEFGRPDLTMSKTECQALLNKLGIEPNPNQLDVLVRRTEGWPAALYLAGMALAEERDLGRAIRQFAGDDRIVVDYVREEFLVSVSQDNLEFLRRTSILDRFNGALCDQVLQTSGSAKLLRELSRSNLLLVPLDRRDEWFRFHPLFREMLMSELRRVEPGIETELHLRATGWWAGQGDIDKAIYHSIEGDAHTLTGELLWAGIAEYMTRGRIATVAGWLDQIGEPAVATNEALSLTAAWAHLTMGEGAKGEHCAAVAAELIGRGGTSADMLPLLTAGLDLVGATMARESCVQMNDGSASAQAVLPDDSPWRALCCLIDGSGLLMRDQKEGAHRTLSEGARRGSVSAPNVQSLCLAQLALLSIDEDDWHLAERQVSQSRSQINRAGLIEYPMMSLALAVSALVRAHSGLIDKAAEDLRIARDLLSRLNDFAPWYEVETRITIARTAIRLGDSSLAKSMLEEAAPMLKQMKDAPRLRDWITRTGAALSSTSVLDDAGLTPAELRVLQFLPTHLSFPQIADRIFVSTNTVKTHSRNVYRKLGVTSRQEAVEIARGAGLLGEIDDLPGRPAA